MIQSELGISRIKYYSIDYLNKKLFVIDLFLILLLIFFLFIILICIIIRYSLFGDFCLLYFIHYSVIRYSIFLIII
jgi:hypothetical protein